MEISAFNDLIENLGTLFEGVGDFFTAFKDIFSAIGKTFEAGFNIDEAVGGSSEALIPDAPEAEVPAEGTEDAKEVVEAATK